MIIIGSYSLNSVCPEKIPNREYLKKNLNLNYRDFTAFQISIGSKFIFCIVNVFLVLLCECAGCSAPWVSLHSVDRHLPSR